MRQLPPEARAAVPANGARNATILTPAPTGTTGTMVGADTGIEPFYLWRYTRTGRLGAHQEQVAVVARWRRLHPAEPCRTSSQPHGLHPRGARSRTGNNATLGGLQHLQTGSVPARYTVAETRRPYEPMYTLGCRGDTIYIPRRFARTTGALGNRLRHPRCGGGRACRQRHACRISRRATQGTSSAAAATGGYGEQTNARGHRPHHHERRRQRQSTGSVRGDRSRWRRPQSVAEAVERLVSPVLPMVSALSPVERNGEIAGPLKGIGGSRSHGLRHLAGARLAGCRSQTQEQNYLATHRVTKELTDICPSCGETPSYGETTVGTQEAVRAVDTAAIRSSSAR